MTGMPSARIAETCGIRAPSSFTESAPAAIRARAVATASPGVRYVSAGMSPHTWVRSTPLRTARTWWAIIARVTARVLS